jgi:cytochrome c
MKLEESAMCMANDNHPGALPRACAIWVLLTGSVISLTSAYADTESDLGVHLLPALGVPAPSDFESVVMPDGTGLPEGEGSVSFGKHIFASHCASCHGSHGKQRGNALVGGKGTLASAAPNRTVGSYWPYATTLFDYINRAMPYGSEKSLAASEVYAVTAYVLHLNDIVPGDAVLNQDNVADVNMPNRDGFHQAPDFEPFR